MEIPLADYLYLNSRNSISNYQPRKTRNPFSNPNACPTKPMVYPSRNCIYYIIFNVRSCNHSCLNTTKKDRKQKSRFQIRKTNRQLSLYRFWISCPRIVNGLFMGKRSMGTLLVMGSKRNMGIPYLNRLLSLYPFSPT